MSLTGFKSIPSGLLNNLNLDIQVSNIVFKMYTPFMLNIVKAIQVCAKQELQINVYNSTKYNKPIVTKQDDLYNMVTPRRCYIKKQDWRSLCFCTTSFV